VFPVNQVFRIGELRKRLLWSGIEQAIWIDIDSDTALPEPISVAELERLLMERELESIADPFEETVLREVEEGSLDQQKRDEAWTMLADFVHDPQLFVRRPRGLIVRGIMERHGVTNQTVYRLLRRYWQRGMCRNALLPDYVNSGARGKRRKPNQAKLGRPRVVMEGKPPAPPADDKAKRLAALLEGMEIPRDIAIPMADELLAENPDIPLAALIHKATAYLAQDAPKRPGISRVKRTEWGGLSEEDLRRRYADGPESEAYDRFKQAGLILDLRPLLRAS